MAIQNIFVVGAGLMGSGIAQNAITSGFNVTINDQRPWTGPRLGSRRLWPGTWRRAA